VLSEYCAIRMPCHEQTWGQFNSGIVYLKKKGIGINKFGIGIEIHYKNNVIHKLIYHLIFLIQKYFFHDNPTWNIYMCNPYTQGKSINVQLCVCVCVLM